MSDQQREYTVQRFGKGFALVFWQEAGERPKRTRRRLTAQTRPAAEAEARAWWQTGDDGSARTVGKLMTGYLRSIAGKVSHQRRLDAWKAMAPFWDAIEPELIDEPMCQQYRAKRRAGEATARYELMQLSTALGWAVKAGHMDRKPSIWLPQPPERKTRHLTRAEFDRFLAQVKADHARLYVAIGVYTMARPSAILELTWDRVDFMRRLIDFTPPGHVRTAKRRTVAPIGDKLLAALQEGHAARTCEFVIERGGSRVASIKKAFQAASERSNVHATPYTLRHTGAVWAAEGGASMAELAQFLGHESMATTFQHYARYSPDYLRGVANLVEGSGLTSDPCSGEVLSA